MKSENTPNPLEREEVLSYLNNIGFSKEEIDCFTDLMTGMGWEDLRLWHGTDRTNKCINQYIFLKDNYNKNTL